MIIRDLTSLNSETLKLCFAQQELIITHSLPFKTFETLRLRERQLECRANGSSHVDHSVHEDGDAWDEVLFIEGKWRWEPIFWYQVLGILTVSLIPNVTWGADWNGKNFWYDENFKDFCHYERRIS
jgi:hypothetical protein